MSATNQIRYSSNFKKIVTVEILHDFFNDQICRSFEFEPTTSTQKLLTNYGLLFKSISNGFVLIASGDSRFKGITFNGPFLLTFDLKNTDPLFLNYTELPGQKEFGFEFENTNENFRLHPNEFVDEACLLMTEKMLTGQIKLTLNQSNQFFGEPDETKTSIEETYSISFKSREILVRYNFYSSNKNFVYADLYITDEDNSLKLSGIEKRTLFSGKEVYSITREEPIKLFQYLQKQFFLKKEDSFLNTFSIQLPQPELKNISFNAEKNNFIGEVFISLD